MGELDQEISELERQISELMQRLSVLEQRRAEETCPFKVGDVVVTNDGHRGVVVQIRPGYFGTKVRLFKRDGSLGKRTNDYYSWKSTGVKFEGEIHES
jgi:hypothetical protein